MRSRVLGAVLGLVLAVGLIACSDDQEPPAPETSESSGASPATTSPTATPSPSVVPATGPERAVKSVSMRLLDSPEWDLSEFGTSVGAGLSLDSGRLEVFVSDSASVPAGGLDQGAETTIEVLSTDDLVLQRSADRTLDGTECYVIEGSAKDRRVYLVGGVAAGRSFDIRFELPADEPQGDALIEQMLATVDVRQ